MPHRLESAPSIRSEVVRSELARILASTDFAEAERARSFLRFIVENTLAGRSHEIKETVIGIDVFGRPVSFDPRSDPIVRVEAGRLRSRLISYYQSEGAKDEIVIEVPKGSYVPNFRRREPVTVVEPAVIQAPPYRRSTLLIAAGVVLGVMAAASAWLISVRDRTADPEGIALSVLPPEGTVLKNAAISPDGRYLAFTASKGETTSLWVRAMNSLEAHPLSGTEQAAYPFWSPDSNFLGFFAVGKMKTIARSGGPAKEVCAVGPAFGGTWGVNGVILFAGRPGGAVMRVAASGGTPIPVTTVDRPSGEVAHLFPSFLPDGEHFLYSVVSLGPGDAVVRVGSLHRPDRKQLISADIGVQYMPSHTRATGSLVFAYHGALMSQPFDTGRLVLAGSASQLAPQVRHVEGRAEFSVSSNGVVAYQAGSEKDRQLTWFDRSGRELSSVGPSNDYLSVSLSPDEKHLAVELEDPSSGRLEVWIEDLESGSMYRNGAQNGTALSPIWSADSRAIVYSQSGKSGLDLVRQPVDSLAAIPQLQTGGVTIATDWSSDGAWLAYMSSWPQRDWLGVSVTRLSGSANSPGRSLSPGGHNECCATFSHSRGTAGPQWIAYSSDETGQNEVYVRDLPAADHRWKISSGGGWLPHWAEDGTLFYLAPEGMLMHVDWAATPQAQAHTPEPLFDTRIRPYSYPALPGNQYSVSTDGKRILVNYRTAVSRSESITVLHP